MTSFNNIANKVPLLAMLLHCTCKQAFIINSFLWNQIRAKKNTVLYILFINNYQIFIACNLNVWPARLIETDENRKTACEGQRHCLLVKVTEQKLTQLWWKFWDGISFQEQCFQTSTWSKSQIIRRRKRLYSTRHMFSPQAEHKEIVQNMPSS